MDQAFIVLGETAQYVHCHCHKLKLVTIGASNELCEVKQILGTLFTIWKSFLLFPLKG